jgi:hypothetical protein
VAFKNVLILCGFFVLSYLFFGLATDNGFWHSDDFLCLEHSLLMLDDFSHVFDSQPPFKFQPLVYLISYLLFRTLHFDSAAYALFNILLHALNSFLVYMLIQTVLKDRTVALLSSFLFLMTVGSYGKSVMIISGFEDLFITTLTLLTMIFYFKNELDAEGRIFSGWFFLAFVMFLASMFTKGTSFAILGSFLAFNFFFRAETGKRVFSANFLVLLVIAIASLFIKTGIFGYRPTFYTHSLGLLRTIFFPARNTIHYLIRMVFPIHTSHLVSEAGPLVRFIYGFATEIRIIIALTILSYSFFGFIFGNRPIRFFIAWTYIMVFPFAFFQFPYDWLNIRHLYLVSVGFVVVISAGAVFCSRLIIHHRYRRFIPMVVPLFFVILSRFIVGQLDDSYERKAASPATLELKDELANRQENVFIEEGRLVYRE